MEALKLQEVIMNQMIVFHVLDCSVELFSSETAYGWMTVAEVAGNYVHFNNDLINVETAINVWQYLNGRLMSMEEIQQVMDDNVLRFGA